MVVVATDLLALTLLRPPGEFGADVAVGSAQRFGVPMGYGGPHAAFLATRDELQAADPGRVIGVSRDRRGKTAFRMALQTREQHIRREKATSNICTAQVLLAIMAGMYAVYHGPEGLRRIARRVHALAAVLAEGLRRLGYDVGNEPFFDTLRVELGDRQADDLLRAAAEARRINLRRLGDHTVGIALDEATTVSRPGGAASPSSTVGTRRASRSPSCWRRSTPRLPAPHARTSEFLTHPVFNRYHTEHEMLRYIKRLEARDLSLATSMIPLGSCTMKLNATSEMIPVTWPRGRQPPPVRAAAEQAEGYKTLFRTLEQLALRDHRLRRLLAAAERRLAGRVRRPDGDPRLAPRAGRRRPRRLPDPGLGARHEPGLGGDGGHEGGAGGLRRQRQHRPRPTCGRRPSSTATGSAALMVTYPSTHGVFEEGIREICEIVHEHGGQVYLDGANMNAQVGLCRPGDYGADVCHLNLHKTFCIPHGGGGPGMGPICVAAHLAPFLPGHPVIAHGRRGGRSARSRRRRGAARASCRSPGSTSR